MSSQPQRVVKRRTTFTISTTASPGRLPIVSPTTSGNPSPSSSPSKMASGSPTAPSAHTTSPTVTVTIRTSNSRTTTTKAPKRLDPADLPARLEGIQMRSLTASYTRVRNNAGESFLARGTRAGFAIMMPNGRDLIFFWKFK